MCEPICCAARNDPLSQYKVFLYGASADLIRFWHSVGMVTDFFLYVN